MGNVVMLRPDLRTTARRRMRMAFGIPTIEARRWQAYEDMADVLLDPDRCRGYLGKCYLRMAEGDLAPYETDAWWYSALASGELLPAARAVGLPAEWVLGLLQRYLPQPWKFVL